VKRPAAACGEQQKIVPHALAAQLPRTPVVAHLVIVPLGEHRHLGVEGAQVRVEQIVFVVAAEVGERLGDPRFLVGHQIAPDLAVGHRLTGADRAVRVDGVTRMDEEVGLVGEHGRIRAHAAARLVDAPALARGVARPHERDRLRLARRGAQPSDRRLAENCRLGQILEADAIADVGARRQVLDQRLGGEVAFRQRIDGGSGEDVAEAVGRRHLDQHAGRPVGARPHDA
jgi:hypothetical protein